MTALQKSVRPIVLLVMLAILVVALLNVFGVWEVPSKVAAGALWVLLIFSLPSFNEGPKALSLVLLALATVCVVLAFSWQPWTGVFSFAGIVVSAAGLIYGGYVHGRQKEAAAE